MKELKRLLERESTLKNRINALNVTMEELPFWMNEAPNQLRAIRNEYNLELKRVVKKIDKEEDRILERESK